MTAERGQAYTVLTTIRAPWAAVLALSWLAGLMWLARASLVGPRFLFLWWNLALAWVPWVLSAWYVRAPRHALTTAGVVSGWLAFFPNAPYLVTDLIHLKERPPVPLFLDALLLASFALAGCALGWTSLEMMRQHVERTWGRPWSLRAVVVVVALTGFGIFLGRVLRLNSWDVVTRPRELTAAVLSASTDPLALALSASFAAYVGAGYLLVLDRSAASD
jgi:uncharacterized membrane protein